MTTDATGIDKSQRMKTFLLNLGAWPRSYKTPLPLDETRKRLLKHKWELIHIDRDRSCCFEKQSMRLYVHFLGFAVVTGPYVPVNDVIADCGKSWLGKTSLPWKKARCYELDGSDWSGDVASAMMDLMLGLLKDWTGGLVVGGQINDADRLFLQCQRVHELFPPNNEEEYRDGLAKAVGLMERVRRNASMEFKSNKKIAVVETVEAISIPLATFLAGLGVEGAQMGEEEPTVWVLVVVLFVIYLFTRCALKECDVEETPILQLPDETND